MQLEHHQYRRKAVFSHFQYYIKVILWMDGWMGQTQKCVIICMFW